MTLRHTPGHVADEYLAIIRFATQSRGAPDAAKVLLCAQHRGWKLLAVENLEVRTQGLRVRKERWTHARGRRHAREREGTIQA